MSTALDSSISSPASPQTVSVLGGGNFGTVIANVLAENGHTVRLWVRRQALADNINQQRENTQYLPGLVIHDNVTALTDLAECVETVGIVFMSIPSKSVQQVASDVAPHLAPNAIIVSTTKGIQADGFKLMSELLEEKLIGHPVVALSGPNIAAEIAQKQFSATVVAHDSLSVCDQVADVLHNTYFRVYSNTDRYGVELAGALKNIYAIIAGFADAMGLGYNTKSMLMTRSLAEMSRLAVKLGADPLTFLGLAGVGDLFVTCTSPSSRNFRMGAAIGEGKNLEQAEEAIGQVVEGVNTLKTIKEKSTELDVYMPLVDALHGLMFEGKSLDELISGMMASERAVDVSFSVE